MEAAEGLGGMLILGLSEELRCTSTALKAPHKGVAVALGWQQRKETEAAGGFDARAGKSPLQCPLAASKCL